MRHRGNARSHSLAAMLWGMRQPSWWNLDMTSHNQDGTLRTLVRKGAMTERDPDFVLDGNAAAGLLQEIFVPEITAAQIQCTGRGATRAVGALCLYAAPMGAVPRCTVCDEVLPRTVHTPHGRWLEMIAARYLIF
jgi:hypothetical protein